MAATITIADVKDGFDTDLPDSQITIAITLANQADACLDKNAVPDDVQSALKVLAARHILSLQANSGRGEITSQSAPSGASQSFGRWQGKGGSPFYGLIEQLDKYGCIKALFENNAGLLMRSVG